MFKISVAGTGYVGLVAGVCFAEVGHHVTCTYSHLYRIPATGLRFFTVCGPMGRPDMANFSFSR